MIREKKNIVIIIGFVLFFACFTTKAQKVTYNHIVNSTDSETLKVMELFENYFSSSSQNEINADSYWNNKEKLKYKNFDFLEKEFQPSLYMGFPAHILSITSDNSLYKIKVQFSYCNEAGVPYVLAIVNYFAEKENGAFRLKNALTVNRQNWNYTNVGLVDFYYPKYHSFTIDNAEKLNRDILEMCENLDVEPIPFEYYFADDYDEVQLLKGIDYYIGMGGEVKPAGTATDNKVYCGGLGENYLHEVFHLQIDRAYPDKHWWISEGMATFLGGSRGKNLHWHIQRSNTYLKEHQNIDLNHLLELANLDEYTSYHYALGGLIVKKVFDKGGWNLLKEFMKTGTKDKDYYQAIETFLGIQQKDLNEYLRKELEYESRV